MKKTNDSQKEKKKDEKKKCFIIMPITTPEILISEYSGGEDHFAHVLDQIFIPAIEKSNLDPIPPKVAGSGLIQADIIKNLETADLVLCDMSTLNPNVFFEFGIRTALNKPVSLVVDDKTPKIPFDPSIIHHHKYNSALQNWTHKEDISSLSEHINESLKKSKKENSLWKYFGLSSFAHSVELKEDEQAQWSYLIKQIESLKEKIEEERYKTTYKPLLSGHGVQWGNVTLPRSGVQWEGITTPKSRIQWKMLKTDEQELIEAAVRALLGISDFDVLISLEGGYHLVIREKVSDNDLKKLKDFMKESNIKLDIFEESSS